VLKDAYCHVMGDELQQPCGPLAERHRNSTVAGDLVQQDWRACPGTALRQWVTTTGILGPSNRPAATPSIRCAPRRVQRICCFFAMRLLIT